MAKTLLDAVNEIFKRTGQIAGDSGELTSLTDSARQVAIDVAIQVVNEANDDLYATQGVAFPTEQSEGIITLVDGDRDYVLETDLVQLRWPFIDKANNQFLTPYIGGYNQMLIDDPEQDDTGLPHWGAIRPTDGELYLDRAPTSVEAGRVYTYQYDRDLVLVAAADPMPFSDATFRAMVPAWVQLWKRERQNEFDGDLFTVSIGRASRFITESHATTNYFPR